MLINIKLKHIRVFVYGDIHAVKHKRAMNTNKMKTGKNCQATLFGMQVTAHNLSRSNDTKTRQLVVDKGIRQWNEIYKGMISFN